MKSCLKFLLIVSFFSVGLPAATTSVVALETGPSSYMVAKTKKRKKKKSKKKRRSRRSKKSSSDLVKALKLAKSGKYQEASQELFRLSQSPRYKSKRLQIKYLLGLMLFQMKLHQVSAFQFISVVKSGNSRYLRQSLEKLSLAADALGDDTLLNYAIGRVKSQEFPRVHRDMLFFRIGEFQLRQDQYDSAARSFDRVRLLSPLYGKAKYLQALAYSQSNKTKSAMTAFEELIDAREEKGITDDVRVAAIMGKARIHYQRKEWDKAIQSYRRVPRDTALWHDTLFESSWAMLRSGRFRSALSNFQSLHSPYYDETYIPESLLVRSIVYLYICQYDEMEKVLNLFTQIYKPVYKGISSYLKSTDNAATYFDDVVKVLRDYNKGIHKKRKSSYPIPFIVTRRLIKEGDFQRSYDYIRKLLAERRRIKSQTSKWRKSAIGKYAIRTINRRLQKARARAGRQIRGHLINMRADLLDLFEQEGFIRYEMINGKKEALKKKVAGKDLPSAQVGESRNRDFYIENGYQFWDFRGEYWLDELGNYFYVGKQTCK